MFNQSQPAEDRGQFLDGFASYLQGTGRYSADEATAVAATLLPDILTYDWATPSRFPNGRTQTDDVSDWRVGAGTAAWRDRRSRTRAATLPGIIARKPP